MILEELDKKVCVSCLIEKSFFDFNLKESNINEFKDICIECESYKKKEYAKLKRKKRKFYSKETKTRKQQKIEKAARESLPNLRFFIKLYESPVNPKERNFYWVADEQNPSFGEMADDIFAAQDRCNELNQL
jgi:hypothetical protein